MRAKSNLLTWSSLVGAMVGICAPASAITLELRPVSQSAYAGQTVKIGLYAVANPAAPMGIVNAVLAWGSGQLTLVDYDPTGAAPWQSAGFPSVSLNNSFSDGDAYFTASINPCVTVDATPAGTLVTTLVYTSGPSYGTSQANVVASLSGFQTRIWNNHTLFGCGGQPVAVTLGAAVSVTVNPCLSALNCNDQNGCTADACNGGQCTHTANYNTLTHCCNPANGATTVITDNRDCTSDICNSSTGAVTHTNKTFNTPCGSTVQDSCTNPDTCDAGGNCLSNNVTNGAVCNDNDSCSQASSCQNGVCTGSNPVPNNTPCTDAFDCTTGAGLCTNGKCIEPTPRCSGGTPFCIETPTCNKDPDCGPQGPCMPNNLCAAGYTCWGCLTEPKPCISNADCPSTRPCENGVCRNCNADVGCVTRYCSPFSHACVNVQNNNLCVDSTFCNGDETCDIFGNCQPANPPTANCPAGTVCNETDDNCVECVDTSNCPAGRYCNTVSHVCVQCLSNGHCNDGNSCNGVETCNLSTGVCNAGTPVVCPQPRICTIDVCNTANGLCEPRPAEQVACSQQNPCPIGFLCGPGNFCVPTNACTDNNGCTINDTCANGVCVGQALTSNGPVNLQLSAVSTPFTIGQTVDVKFNLLRPACTPCSTGNPMCNPGSAGCIDSCCQPGINSAETNVTHDPLKLGLQSPASVDPCTNHAGDPLNCPLGPPRQYDWFSSGLLANFDPDGLNDNLTDGNFHYIAFVGPGSPDAPVTPISPLWVTTLKFTALKGTTSSGTQVTLNRCTGPDGTFSRVSEGSGTDATGQLLVATVKIRCGNTADCQDNNACTTDTCNLSTLFCEYTNVANGTACGNGTPTSECDLPDSCLAGVCNSNPKSNATPCTDDGNQCTSDLCNGAGACAHTNKPAGTTCNDNQFCTIGEVCNVGFCGGGSQRSCADSFSCTIDSCNEATDTCDHTPDNDACNDFQYCNGVEVCSVTAGCQPGTPPNCSSDGIACTENDFCNESLNVCDGVPNDSLCPPGQFCIPRNGCLDTPCRPPFAVSAGSRYIGITPQPPNSTEPVAIFIDSARWSCLGKYVGTPTNLDNDGNGTVDGKVAKLVDNPINAAVLTPAQWGGTVWVTGKDIVPSDRNFGPGPPVNESNYRVYTECAGGVLSPPTDVVMLLWGDSDENGIISITDTHLAVQVFQGRFHLPPGPNNGDSTKILMDLSGVRLCDPDINPGSMNSIFVNFTDIGHFLRSFQGYSYKATVEALPPQDGCSMPCP